jgi:small subunit ribosomal protein S14
MSKKSLIMRNEKRLLLVAKYRTVRDNLKAQQKLCRNSDSGLDAISIALQLDAIPKNASRVRTMMRCMVTGKARVMRKYGVCRNVLQKMISEGKLPGYNLRGW